MRDAGGFEGNAQTLRILSKLEKRQTLSSKGDEPIVVQNGKDQRTGLNLAYRTLAAILKYDHQIPRNGKGRGGKVGPIKGYYYTEAPLLEQLKQHAGGVAGREFKTIECSIMDLADDIAYSTYDLEDSFKAGFLTPLSMLAAPQPIVEAVAHEVSRNLDKAFPDIPPTNKTFRTGDVYLTLLSIFAGLFDGYDKALEQWKNGELSASRVAAAIATVTTMDSDKIAQRGYYRTKLTSELVGSFIRAVQVKVDKENLALSKAYLDINTFKQVEVLKKFAYQSLIMSSRLKVAEHRGKEIVTRIFKALDSADGHLLMPEDCRSIYSQLVEPHEQQRVVCDFIAGMTDRYAIQFYSRLFGTNAETIYSPL